MAEASSRYHVRKQRRWRRHELVVPLGVVIRTPGENDISGRGGVVGLGGLSLFALAELPLGDEVEIVFRDSPSGMPIRMRGAVRNRAAYLYGIEFLVQTPGDRIELARLNEVISTQATN